MSDPVVSVWWQAACLPEKWEVAGIAAPSLTVWHTFALDQMGNRYVCGGAPTMDDAASLLLVASQDFRRGRWLLLSSAWRSLKIARIYRKLKRANREDVDRACREYVATCLRVADRWMKADSAGGKAAVPYQWHLVRVLMLCGMTMDEAWNTPYAVARCLFDADAESRGDNSLMSPEAQALDDKMFAEKNKK